MLGLLFVCFVRVCARTMHISPTVIRKKKRKKKEHFMKIFSLSPPELPGFDQFCFLHVGGSCICLNNCISLLLCTAEDLVTQ